MRTLMWATGASVLAYVTPAHAQQIAQEQERPAAVDAAPVAQGTPTAQLDTAETDEIIVSASRIDRSGFVAPSPTLVVGADTLKARSAVNVADVINELPAFRRTQSPEAGGIGNSGANNIDLRGLGPVRTLVLLDRMRLPAVNLPGATVAGATDLNLIPAALIARVDVVTGGASAAYGSDAVAGVVNLQLDTKLKGFKATAQWGQTRYGDATDRFVSLAKGTSFAGGRGHFVIGGEYNKNDGTSMFNDKRAWGRSATTSVAFGSGRAAGTPANVIGSGIYYGTLTTGGLITPNVTTNPAGLRNLQFVAGANGAVTAVPFDAGQYQGQIGTRMIGGSNVLPVEVLRPETERYNLVAHLDYQISDHLQIWARGLYSDVDTKNLSAEIRAATGGTTSFLTLSKNNPYLQAALTPAQLAQIPANGSLTIGYLGYDFGAPKMDIRSKTTVAQAGLKGELGGGWRWDAGAQFSRNSSRQVQSNTAITNNFRNAIDAVVLNGQTVCSSAAARAAGCQPINILGKASYTPEAYAYAFGTSTSKAVTTLFEASANINGEPFSTWAGPVSVASGVEFRRETFRTDVDALSQAGAFMARTPRNFPKVGQSVKEVYLETIVPLLRQDWGVGSLDFNGAIRRTDYSVSGAVTTWKTGLVWKPIRDIMLRGTLSRDIRAPSLPELYTPAVQTVPRPLYADLRPAFAGKPSYTYDSVTGGNVGLKPEVSNTLSFGAVLNPRFAHRFQLSVDYYRIKIREAIGATGAATALTNCLGTGTADLANPFCQLITFANNDPVNGAVLSVLSQNANFAEFKTRGIDIAASYVQPLDEIIAHAPGRLTFGAQATHALEYRSTFDVSLLFPNGINRAGQTGSFFGGTSGVPDWSVNTTIGYRDKRFGANVQYRWISRSHFNNGLVGPDDPSYSPTLVNSINNNIVPARSYVNLNLSYNLASEEKPIEIYGTINNLFDQDPPLPAIGNNAYYDLLGRAYRIGVRLQF
jgi:iron complex outermembrane recepter protein